MIQLNFFKLLIMIQPLLFSQTFYDLSIEGINGEKILFQDYKGKYVLIVNVASRCGYTSQYSDLQKLSQTYDNLVVLGVPCNQFGFQEPKSESEIFKFCSNNSIYTIFKLISGKALIFGSPKNSASSDLAIS